MRQKSWGSCLLRIIVILFLLYSVIDIAGMWFDYHLVLYHDLIESAAATTILLGITLFLCIRKIDLDGIDQILVSLLLPLTILVQIYLITREGSRLWQALYILFALISIVSVACLFFRYHYGLAFKIICGISSILLTVAFVLITCVVVLEIIAGEFGRTRIIKQVPSPDQSYVAEVVDVDLGATGGNTLVNVRNKRKDISVLVGTLVYQHNIYDGHWGEFQTMEIHWSEDDVLVIDGKEYDID